ncbi:PilZ domain-containing protein [Microvirga sp. BT689]|uniref:PilZ domain-containing protein n=1 Tax=Microvirga arvi TaxID=2778731 RepID=UPI00194EFA3B|nr:PilZ domain-containing protein [Microvirga arvi]MBM6580174.1 PilZ domain-containing protein [Microvirga arvi]
MDESIVDAGKPDPLSARCSRKTAPRTSVDAAGSNPICSIAAFHDPELAPGTVGLVGRGAGRTLPWALISAFRSIRLPVVSFDPSFQEDPWMQSRRLSKRLPSLLEGRIRLEPQGLHLPCTIRDLSMTGARLWLPGAVDLPEEFELEIPILEQAVAVRLMWSEAKTYGVMFLGELHPPADDAGLRLLEQLRTPSKSS